MNWLFRVLFIDWASQKELKGKVVVSVVWFNWSLHCLGSMVVSLNTQISSFTKHQVSPTLANQLPGARCLPRAHEMLFCAPNTSWPQLDAFLSRCRHVQGGWSWSVYPGLLGVSPPRLAGKSTMNWRWITSYWTWGIFQCHVSELRGVRGVQKTTGSEALFEMQKAMQFAEDSVKTFEPQNRFEETILEELSLSFVAVDRFVLPPSCGAVDLQVSRLTKISVGAIFLG